MRLRIHKPEVGFNLSFAALVDPENNDQIQLTTNCPIGATAADLHDAIATMRTAVWLERLAVNERLLKKGLLLNAARDKRVEEFRSQGEPIDEEMLADERAVTNVSIATLQAKVESLKALNGHGA